MIALVLLSELQLDRYKYVVQVVLGEQRGEGVRYVTLQERNSLPIKDPFLE